jgi:hypothetical protein
MSPERRAELVGIVAKMTAAYVIEGNFGRNPTSEDWAIDKSVEVALKIQARVDRLEKQSAS